MLTATTQALLQVQHILQAPHDGLHATAAKMLWHPALVMPNFAAQHATHMRQALAQRWALQQFLPTEAANDALPGAA
jgi:uncharacterized membrane protein